MAEIEAHCLLADGCRKQAVPFFWSSADHKPSFRSRYLIPIYRKDFDEPVNVSKIHDIFDAKILAAVTHLSPTL
jgi:hypothetical protein